MVGAGCDCRVWINYGKGRFINEVFFGVISKMIL